MAEPLRDLPAVDAIAARIGEFPRPIALAAARAAIGAARDRIREGDLEVADGDAIADEARARATALGGPSLRRVVNATGVVLHTNLGRAPLAADAVEQVAAVAGAYSNLELDLREGDRGSRQAHVESLLLDLTGADAAIAVNNNAAAVLLALTAIARDREVLTSRGELVEIGGAFRIPEILEQSGAVLVEVGTTNRTRLADYEAACGANTAAILCVHQSNFRTVGFTESAQISELATLARERGLTLICDLGSGALSPREDEPVVSQAMAAGAGLACFSADKLLGGPQAGIIVGEGEAVERCRTHPLARALRLDKLQLAALEATLRLHRDGNENRIPALAMLDAPEDALAARAERIRQAIGDPARVRRSASRPGGGALPLTELEGPVVAVDPPGGDADALAAALRAGEPPVICRISDGAVILDPRTMSDDDARLAAEAARATLG